MYLSLAITSFVSEEVFNPLIEFVFKTFFDKIFVILPTLYDLACVAQVSDRTAPAILL